MKCTKCKTAIDRDGREYQTEVEMEDKGAITGGYTKLSHINYHSIHLYQCPACKNIEIQ